MESKDFAVKGDIIYAKAKNEILCKPNTYIVCNNGICEGVFDELPEKWNEIKVYDYTGQLVMPGMTDLHVHAPQYTFRGLGMDLELLEWLQVHTFPEEAKYQDLNYAKQAYSYFTEDLKNSFTTRACIFATLHREATLELMDQLEKTGLITYVGKVNMDRNGSARLCEKSAEESANDTKVWLDELTKRSYQRTMPILTPRFIPSCSDELMRKLSKIQKEYKLRVQSHLSENLSEIAWVKELVPESSCYGQAYELFDMIGSAEYPAIMAHCVYSSEEEMELLKSHHTYIAHCPDSNFNVASGIAPIRKYLEYGISVGFGSDVAGGASLSIPQSMAHAIQASKMYWRMKNQNIKPLTFDEVFYMATLGGGSYFGNVGSFEKGYECDLLVIDDSKIRSMRELSVKERAERMIYLPGECTITDKFVAGKRIHLA